jgi:DNA primase
MDPVADIKARLPIEQLVGEYCQLQKKGRSYKALCPFHKDKNPSLLVSPDKGLAWCFACQSGGDVFGFYQKIEGVDFRTALKDLAEKTGIELKDQPAHVMKKDEKEQIRLCLEEATRFYQSQLKAAPAVLDYLQKRGVPETQIAQFQIGFAPDSYSATYEYLLKAGFSRSEILAAGLGVQRELKEERIYDRFRHRLMFPITDVQGRVIGFGGRTMGEDDAKYLNSSDGPLYRKSSVLFGIDKAREAIREANAAILVEGYFDVLACHRAGATNAVATCGTALTEEHVKILKRHAERVILCLDSDRAGREAAERAFQMLAREDMPARIVALPTKDAADLAAESPDRLQDLLQRRGVPYMDHVLEELRATAETSEGKRAALERLLPLLDSIQSRVLRSEEIRRAAAMLRSTESDLVDDLRRFSASALRPALPGSGPASSLSSSPFSGAEIALGIFLLHPRFLPLLAQLIAPEEGFPMRLYAALDAVKDDPADAAWSVDALGLSSEDATQAKVLQLFCEQHGFADWSESLVARELKRNCQTANREVLRRKQKDIAAKMLAAQAQGRKVDEALLQTQYQQVLKLAKMAS